MPAYFDQDWSGGNKCKVVSWMTGYSIYAPDDYKRCICDKFGNGEADCAAADQPDPVNPDPPVDPDPVDPD